MIICHPLESYEWMVFLRQWNIYGMSIVLVWYRWIDLYAIERVRVPLRSNDQDNHPFRRYNLHTILQRNWWFHLWIQINTIYISNYLHFHSIRIWHNYYHQRVIYWHHLIQCIDTMGRKNLLDYWIYDELLRFQRMS